VHHEHNPTFRRSCRIGVALSASADTPTLPSTGKYTFGNATSIPANGTMLTADEFLIIDRYDGSRSNAPVGGDEFGIYINTPAIASTSFTSIWS
jgi:hypothetical protein